jgi:hypothetical protein
MSGMTRYPLILAAVAGALALEACGSGNDGRGGTASADGQDRAFEGALRFAKCMRDHGVDMPDPKRDSNGGIRLKAGIGAGADRAKLKDPKMRAAQSACRKYLENGGGQPPDPAQQAKLQDAFVAYAGCMRGKGIDMPDPKVRGHGVQMRLTNPDSPAFKAADKACHHFLAGVGGKGTP